jgi:RHS repeat-associated protein
MGATSSDATVTVNGASAATYNDNTFAVANMPWTTNYTAIASDGYGQWATNTVTVNLATQTAFQYDGNGNLTNDGLRSFAYDDENQLTQVWVSNQWLSQFAYDGKMRRRIRQEYTWQSGAWVQTNVVHYVYDGNVVIQERDLNNWPATTYTRGKDLSGSLEGAGGIGGLLSMTLNGAAGPLSSNSMYYHSDGNGNVTALIAPSQTIVAKYIYDAFGNVISKSGQYADANPYRFSSKEAHPASGLVYYLYRYYDPNLQRWLNQDPIGERGGINLYGFVGNDPVNRVDPLGLTFVVSPTPFPGQEGTYGPYVLNIPDGSSLVKSLHHLDPNSLYKNEYKTCQSLQSKSPWEALNPGDEAGFDTPYFRGLNADDREYYEYNGEIFADNEINYFGIGMYENWAGDPLAVAIGITDAWKLSQYGRTPNDNTFYWLEKGYNDYSGFTDPSQPAPGK